MQRVPQGVCDGTQFVHTLSDTCDTAGTDCANCNDANGTIRAVHRCALVAINCSETIFLIAVAFAGGPSSLGMGIGLGPAAGLSMGMLGHPHQVSMMHGHTQRLHPFWNDSSAIVAKQYSNVTSSFYLYFFYLIICTEISIKPCETIWSIIYYFDQY